LVANSAAKERRSVFFSFSSSGIYPSVPSGMMLPFFLPKPSIHNACLLPRETGRGPIKLFSLYDFWTRNPPLLSGHLRSLVHFAPADLRGMDWAPFDSLGLLLFVRFGCR